MAQAGGNYFDDLLLGDLLLPELIEATGSRYGAVIEPATSRHEATDLTTRTLPLLIEKKLYSGSGYICHLCTRQTNYTFMQLTLI